LNLSLQARYLCETIVAPSSRAAICALVVCLSTLASCAPKGAVVSLVDTPGATTTAASSSAATLSLHTISRDAPLGSEPDEPLYTVVASPDGWDKLRGRLPDRALEAGAQSGPSRGKLTVVAFAGVRPSSGYRVTVERIVQERAQLIVTVALETPAPEGIVEPATTLPYHLVALSTDQLPRRPLSFIFRDLQGTDLASGQIRSP
jgi:hypothetical protein